MNSFQTAETAPSDQPISPETEEVASGAEVPYEFSVDMSGVTFIGVEIAEEMDVSAHGGTYDGATASFSTEELDSGLPLQISPPVRLPDVGATRHVRPGLYMSSADIEYLARWYRDDVEISGTIGQSYTLTAQDDYRQIEYREHPVTAQGSAPAAPYVVVAQHGYQEVGLDFSNLVKLETASVATMNNGAGTDKVLIFVSYNGLDVTTTRDVLQATGGARVFLDRNNCGGRIAGGTITGGGAGYGMRQHMLISLDGIAADSVKVVRHSAGGAVATTVSPTWGAILDTASKWNVAGRSNLEMYRLAIWSPSVVPDIVDPNVQARFFANDALQPPHSSIDLVGEQPLIDIYGNVALANNGIDFLNAGGHYGTVGGGLFETVTGSIAGVVG